VDFLLDTNGFSDLMRADPQVEARLAALPASDRVVICTVVRGEILFGIQRLPPGRRRRGLGAKAASLFAVIPCEPVPEAAGDLYATLKLDRQRLGLGLDENDLWIAATALALGAVLVTRDLDFSGLTGLRAEDWTA
jgi:tRNA(fMet)-specific endonuclease VapC